MEVNIDYILLLVSKYHESHCTDKNILTTIDRAIGSSMALRSKKELIEGFIKQVNTSTNVDDDWYTFVEVQKESDLAALIQNEKLKPEETRRFLSGSFRDGALKTTGTSIDKILPLVSRFSGDRSKKKAVCNRKTQKFFEKYF